jgi:predicted nucleotide-binding protein
MPPLIDRFQGSDGLRVLKEALSQQTVLANVSSAVDEIAPMVRLSSLGPGATLLSQDDAENDLYFILAGELSIVVNGRPIARRGPGETVGEMTLVDPSARRAATVIPLTESVVAKISEADFSALAAKHPDLWRKVALVLSRRLRQRNNLVEERRKRPLVFLGSSREALPLASAMADHFEHDPVDVRLWTDSVSAPSKINIEALEAQIRLSDFAVLALTPDDRLFSRGTEHLAPRDNIIFELGLFMGAAGRERTFLLQARGVDLKIPTDLLGIIPLAFEPDSSKSPSDLVKDVANDLRKVMLALGPL